MSLEVVILNRQRAHRVDAPRLRRIAEELLTQDLRLEQAELGVHLLRAPAMAKLNWRWLQHEGSTDVITFDHRDRPQQPLNGELFISLDDAVAQAGPHATTPSEELVRYLVHGVLHLLGHDDLSPGPRRLMKREENRLVRRLTGRHDLRRLFVPGRAVRAPRGGR